MNIDRQKWPHSEVFEGYRGWGLRYFRFENGVKVFRLYHNENGFMTSWHPIQVQEQTISEH